ncbi:unnamed protein product [Cylicocyclus nassatus]|uniref:Uncharacterized protein n=1 Tax=Cylicocyclus nassatus TaxID=53992 RepID=A0AA36DPU4_CYLNA|nr:unnamed protein product [Cylicocyclus nassatus]
MNILRIIYSKATHAIEEKCECATDAEAETENTEALTTPWTSTPFRSKSPSQANKTIALSLAESFEELRLESAIKAPRCNSPARIAAKFINSLNELALAGAVCSLHDANATLLCYVGQVTTPLSNSGLRHPCSIFSDVRVT